MNDSYTPKAETACRPGIGRTTLYGCLKQEK